MIIRPREPLLDLEEFTAGIQRAARSVVLVEDDMEGAWWPRFTGWILTDHLIVAGYLPPSEKLSRAGHRISYRCAQAPCTPYALEGDAMLVVRSAGRPDLQLMLLKMEGAMPGAAVELGFEAALRGDLVLLVHHAEGARSAKLSTGRVLDVSDDVLPHDANTLPGSGGAPIFDSRWRVIGMHIGRGEGHGTPTHANWGVTRAAILNALRPSNAWPEIAAFHRLADVDAAHAVIGAGEPSRAAAPASERSALLAAALWWSFDPGALPAEERARLQPLVIDAAAPRWALRPAERVRLLRSAPSLEALRAARGHEEAKDTGQRVIDLVLRGAPLDLGALDEDALSHLLQVSRWFSAVVPGLPTPAEVNRALQRRRVRGRLDAIAGPRFKGRGKELEALKAWYDDPRAGPMVVTGIGGMGKSALAARFARGLPTSTVLLWLDFDRADLSPDDAPSVLAALCEQAAAQIERFQAPEIDESDWREGAQALGARLAEAAGGSTSPPLVILDSFEAAQYVERYQELWPVLAAIAEEVPSFRVLVTGRADVPSLTLRGREAARIRLEGLDRAAARAYLEERGIRDGAVLEKVLSIAGGMPLILLLAVRLVEDGGKVADLPETLPPRVLEGVLYDRILGRLKSPAIAKLARGALVLRRLSAEMIRPVLGELVDVPNEDPARTLATLGREMALVEQGEVLRLRADLRAAVLWLLERDDPALVRAIDARAAEWYAEADTTQDAVAAELVYHRLRLGDVEGAAAAWREGCAPLLQDAADELPEPGRAWLGARVGAASASEPPLEEWERDAERRVRNALSRGLARQAWEILKERAARSAASPLVLFDAVACWLDDDAVGAAALLDEAGAPEGAVGRDRTALRALLWARAGDRRAADACLARIDRNDAWQGLRGERAYALVVRAARLQLSVDLEAELRLLELLGEAKGLPASRAVMTFFSPVDFALPALKGRASQFGGVEVLQSIGLRISDHSDYMAANLRKLRRSMILSPVRFLDDLEALFTDDDDGPWCADDLLSARGDHRDLFDIFDTPREAEPSLRLCLDLYALSLRRLRLVTRDACLSSGEALLLDADGWAADPRMMAGLLGAMALVANLLHPAALIGDLGPLNDHIIRLFYVRVQPSLSSKHRAFVARIIGAKGDPERAIYDEEWTAPLRATLKLGNTGYLRKWLTSLSPELQALVVHLLCPDPLEGLVRDLAGIPGSISL